MAEDCILKAFPGTKALSCVKIEVKAGEVHALVGENGVNVVTKDNVDSFYVK